MRTISRNNQAILFAGLLSMGAFLLPLDHMQAQHRLTLKGLLIVPVGTEAPSSAELVASNGERMDIALGRDGGFRVSVPDDDTYTLRFITPGCVTKELVVDARNATTGLGRKDRVVRFEMALHADDALMAERYNGAVGRMTFDRTDGRMTIQHRYELVRLSQLLADGPQEH
jgi:hypothetical protein